MRGNKHLGLTEQKPSLAHRLPLESSTCLTDEETPQEVTGIYLEKAFTEANPSKFHLSDAPGGMD